MAFANSIGNHVMIILQSDAKRIITDHFKAWAAESVLGRSPNSSDGAAYFAHLKAEKSQLLEFRHPSPDKQQVVQSWLSGAGLFED